MWSFDEFGKPLENGGLMVVFMVVFMVVLWDLPSGKRDV